MTDVNPTSDARTPTRHVEARDLASSLHSLLEITRAVRSGADVSSLVDAIARVVAETLGYWTVVLNVYRPEWDDFYVETVYGSDDVREALLGSVYDWDSWKPLLDPKFMRVGAYFIPNEAFDWSNDIGNRFVPADAPTVDGPDGWHPNDEVFVRLERSDGDLVGIMSFGHPLDGRRPDDEQLAVAVALASHAALALEAAQERERSDRHQAGLEQLLGLSSQLPQTVSTEAMLTSVCEGISQALGFEKVLIQLLDGTTGLLKPVASAGWHDEDVAATAVLDLSLISRLFYAQFEFAGCYLVPRSEAESRVGSTQLVYESVLNGQGPYAWDHHWLVVPLRDAAGEVRGVLWADEPRTRLLNRRALLDELGAAAEAGWVKPLALVFLDVDNFKEINDAHGHATGDRVLTRFATLLSELVRQDDHAFRVGGDEFALLLHGAGAQEARDVVARIVAAIEANIDPLVRTLTASFGVATSRGRDEPHELLRVADEAMYQAKRTGTRIEVAA